VKFSGAPVEYELPVTTFGEKIGVAFQLIDDVIDLSSREDETGKTPGTDLRSGVATLPVLYLRRLAETDADAALLLARLQRDVGVAHGQNRHEEDLVEAIAELRAHDVTSRTLAEAHRWAAEAVAALAPLPDGPVKKSRTRFADSIVERSS
jgi:heptaprenyl diphosphate synthase